MYIVLNGKVALYKKSVEYYDQDEVIFVGEGYCFGGIYEWKVSFVPISVESTLVAVIGVSDMKKIPIHLAY